MYPCEQCEKTFGTISNRNLHVRTIHEKRYHVTCDVCGKSTLKKHLERHMKTCNKNNRGVKRVHDESACDPTVKRAKNGCVRCVLCNAGFLTRKERDEHVQTEHDQDKSPIDVYMQYIPKRVREDTQTMRCIQDEVHLIMKPDVKDVAGNKINFYKFNELTFDVMKNQLEELWRMHDDAFKMNIALGFIMTNIETGDRRYFYPERNNGLLTEPAIISTYDDIKKLTLKILDLDVLENAYQQRPNTKYKLTHITNVMYITYNLNYVMGTSECILPNYIMNKRSITTLVKDQIHRKPYQDHLCMFRALACHLDKKSQCKEREVDALYKQWYTKHKISKEKFQGVTLKDVPEFEETYDINVFIYSLNEQEEAEVIYKPTGLHTNTMHVNKYLNHISYINNLNAYAKKYACFKCQKMFTTCGECTQHEKICSDATKLVYPGGYYENQRDVFQQLEDMGITVQPVDRYFENFAVYDLESILIPENRDVGESTKIISTHKPISVSVCSTLDPSSPQCFINEDPGVLVGKMMEQLKTVQQRVSRIMMARFHNVFKILRRYLELINVSSTFFIV